LKFASLRETQAPIPKRFLVLAVAVENRDLDDAADEVVRLAVVARYDAEVAAEESLRRERSAPRVPVVLAAGHHLA
jgi:hypothetical protein